MKIYAHYDADGTIHVLTVADAPSGLNVRRIPRADMDFGEVSGTKVSDARDEKTIRKLGENYRVSVSPRAASLIKRR